MTYANDVTGSNVFTSLDPSMKAEPELQDFWNLETIGIRDEIEVTNDEVAMKKFRDTLTFQNDRYQVTWPWREEEFDLPVNRQLAMGRLKSAVSRLSDKPKLMEKYNKILADQLNQGIIEKVDYKQQDGLLHYLPHQPVNTPQKNTTKLRIVYDASAKTKKQNLSLNECMYRGPVILQDICGMLIRFRIHRVAIVADIEKAFLQIGLQHDQRDFTRFLWLKNTSEPVFSSTNIQEYRFCRVPFGIIASPFLLGATIRCHLELYNNDIAEKVKNNIYVDNLITGTDTDFEGIAF
ncbi:uncharacterized protein LOC132754961 [Ruditapes philippinarum]|uniref:uncharacterized protein LOC132754961 n=1 Tax=Ruditapes philippinarum TaxID=129788 RepID=UPI00295B39A2|nr:uncharacterized protein LOC132754961 [Ruditapes philippinarum]